MDIHSFFRSSSKPLTSASRMSSTSNSDESEEEIEVTPSKKPCICKSSPPKKHSKYCRRSSNRKYLKAWEKDFNWLEYDADCEGPFCKVCKTFHSGNSLERTGGVWPTKPFTNWKKAVEEMKAHAVSDLHIQAGQIAVETQESL